MNRGATAYAPSDIPGKGTNAGARLFRRVICLGRPGPTVSDSGAYAIRPYPDGRLFSSKWVGRNSIRPIRRPRQGDECGCPVISQGNLLGASGPYRARLWGVCCCALRLRFLFFDRQGRGATAYAPSDVPVKGMEVGLGFGCRVRFWDCGGGGGDVTGPYFGLPRGGDCQYGRYFELLRGGD